MRQAILITGFNNWGKTTIIQNLFSGRTNFFQGRTYGINGLNPSVNFTVETHSNDDLTGQRWVDAVQDRINNSSDNGENLFTALCPSMEPANSYLTLLVQPTFSTYDRLHIFLIEYKWEHHAKLIIPNILNSLKPIPNLNIVLINADQNLINPNEKMEARMNQIKLELIKIYN